jgi:glycosyltransferase involved in cell wall biosynthesis
MFSYQKFGGITKYFVELMKNMGPENQVNLGLLFSENHYLKENRSMFKKGNLLPPAEFRGKATLKEHLAQINKLYSRFCISNNDFDVFHPTFYHDYYLGKLKKPFIITVHDLIEFRYKDTFFKNSINRPPMEKVIKKADRIIAISENTKTDLLETFDLNPDKIDVIYHGFNNKSRIKGTNQFGKYILYVGDRGGYKNFRLFIEAVSGLLKKEKDIKVVCVGKPFIPEEMELLVRLNIVDQLVALHVDENTLNNLYANALTFVYPSLYEGFGMPILEAYSNDCPLCLSNTSCFPEIAGSAASYFDPTDAGSIVEAIEKVISDEEYYQQLRVAGKNRLARFSWEKTANMTLESYEKII